MNPLDSVQSELPFASPTKLFFKIGEVAELLAVPISTIRHWEKEFSINPKNLAMSKQRIYHRSDLDTLRKIRHLLYDRKFTVAGAREFLQNSAKEGSVPVPAPPSRTRTTALEELIRGLDEILDILPD